MQLWDWRAANDVGGVEVLGSFGPQPSTTHLLAIASLTFDDAVEQ
jgi:hypothetical protein